MLYEMLTGERAFGGEDITVTLARIVEREPDLSTLPVATPARVSRALSVCLRKDPKQRVQAIGDVRLALEGAFETGVSQAAASVAVSPPAVWRRPVPVALAASLLVGLAVWGVTRPAPQPPAPLARFSIPLAAEETFSGGGRPIVAISPNGRHVAYTTNQGLSPSQTKPVGSRWSH